MPINTINRFIISSADVLHSWALPSIGIKLDATPGRLNQTFSINFIPSILYGQCSEICGANHSFMPIVIEFSSPIFFKKWLELV